MASFPCRAYIFTSTANVNRFSILRRSGVKPGTSDPGDMCFYPQSGRVSLRGLGIALRSPEIEFLLSL